MQEVRERWTLPRGLALSAAKFALCALLTRVTVLSGAPLGAALLLCASERERGYAAVAAAALIGSFTLPADMWFYMCANGVLAMVLLLFLRLRLPRYAGFIAVGTVYLAGCLLFLPHTPFQLLMKAFEALFACAFSFLFRTAGSVRKRKRISYEQAVALCFVATAAVLSLSGLSVAGVYIANAVAAALSVAAGYLLGAAAGAAAGAALAVACVLSGTAGLSFAAVNAVAAGLCGLMQGRNRFFCAGMYLLASCALLFTLSGEAVYIPCAVGAVAAAALPEKLWRRIGGRLDRYVYDGMVTRVCKSAGEELTKRADALMSVKGALSRRESMPEGIEPPLVCMDCERRSFCWEEGRAATEAMALRFPEGVEVNKLPKVFLRTCRHAPEFTEGINAQLLRRSSGEREAEEARRLKAAAATQMDAAASAFAVAGRGATEGFTNEREMFIARTGVCSRASEEVCGDRCSVFDCRGGRYMLLCDGMGRGAGARHEADFAVNVLRGYIEAGAEETVAVKAVNALSAIAPGEAFTTLDLARIDLCTGGLKMLKIGSPLSCILRDKKLIVIEKSALPLGIVEDMRPARVETVLLPGDMLVMMSDGVADVIGDPIAEWFLLLLTEGDEPETLARRIVDSAAAAGGSDDMCVAVTVMGRKGAKNRGREKKLTA